ncbi:MFS transporter [Paenibacillus sp. CC-CFT747]|nr:MFS transporter [Paenibacillus sp. CC-CFT747]
MTNPRPPVRRAFSLFSTVYSIIAAIGGFLFGYDTAVISGAVGFIQERFDLNPGMLGWMVSSLIVGAAAGAASSGVLSDKFGRKKMLIASALIFVAGSIGSAIPSTVTGLIVARIIGGSAWGWLRRWPLCTFRKSPLPGFGAAWSPFINLRS